MAIIRIKRTTGTALPTGLTFGELAFIGATGGATANRLYIAGPHGACVWIGAEILNSPTYWSGTTAETTVPTLSAVHSFASAFVGATVFSSDIVANLSGTKSFGKWTNGQTVTASGKTPIQVITEALIESVQMQSSLQARSGWGDPTITYSAIPFGATAIRIGLTWGYQINTPGATALGGTLEWRRGGVGAWTTISNPPGTTFVYDTTVPFYTQVTPTNGFTLNPFNHWFTQSQYDTTTINYQYTVHDSSGAGATTSTASVSPTGYATPTNSTTVTAQLSEPLGGSSNVLRERGNTGSTLSISFSNNGNDTRWINLTAYQIQYRLNGAGSWYNALNNIANDTTFTSISPPAGTCAATISVKPAVAGITLIEYRAQVKDTFSTSGVVTNPQTIATVSLRKRIFYGATYTNFFDNVTPATIRSLPSSLLGPTSGTAISGASPFSFTFNTSTDGSFLRYVIALPKGLTLNTNADVSTGGVGAVLSTGEVLAGKANPPDDPCQLNLGLTQGTDFSGVVHDYNIFTWSVGDQYSSGTSVTVRCNGTVT